MILLKAVTPLLICSAIAVLVVTASLVPAHGQTVSSVPPPAPTPPQVVAVPALTELGWREFSSQEYGFSALFPGEPQQVRRQAQSPDGPVEVFQFNVRTVSALFGISYTKYPDWPDNEDQFPEADLRLVYDDGRDGAINIMNGRLVSERDIRLGNLRGREILIQIPGGLYRARLYLVGSRLYQAYVISRDYRSDESSSRRALETLLNRFLDSFHIERRVITASPEEEAMSHLA